MNTNSLISKVNDNPQRVNVLKEICQNPTHELTEQTLRDIAYFGYIVSEQGGYQQALYRSIYQQLMKWEFKLTVENFNRFTAILADLIDIAIENLRIINCGTLDNPYYKELFFSILEAALPKTKEASQLIETLNDQFARGRQILPQKKDPLTEEVSQQLANILQKNYKAYHLRSDAGRQILVESWKKLVTLGKTFYQNQAHAPFNEYEIHYQAFTDYAALCDNAQYRYLTALTYSMAKMIQLATQSLTHAKNDIRSASFLVAMEATLGHEAKDILLSRPFQLAS